MVEDRVGYEIIPAGWQDLPPELLDFALLRPVEAAGLLHCSEWNIYAMLRRGDLPFVTVGRPGGKKRRMVRLGAIRAWQEARTTQLLTNVLVS